MQTKTKTLKTNTLKKPMKKPLVLTLSLISLNVFALGLDFDILKKNRFKQGHELSLGYGAVSHDFIFGSNRNICNCSYYHYNNTTLAGLTDHYHALRINMGSITFNYNYRIVKWLDFSMNINYTAQKNYYNYKISNTPSDYFSSHYIGLVPEARFLWYNSKSGIVKLYSSVGVGVGFILHSNYSIHNINSESAIFSGKFIPIGIKLGKGKIYGYAEFGAASTGYALAGVGYRFGKY